jgi:hypothetical protein
VNKINHFSHVMMTHSQWVCSWKWFNSMGETKTLTLICELTPGVRRSQHTQGHTTCSIWQAFLVRRAIGN